MLENGPGVIAPLVISGGTVNAEIGCGNAAMVTNMDISGGKLILNCSDTNSRCMEITGYGQTRFAGNSLVELNGGWLEIRGDLQIAEDARVALTETRVGVYEHGTLPLDGGEMTIDHVWDISHEDGWPNSIHVDRNCRMVVNDGSLTMNVTDFNKGLMASGDCKDLLARYVEYPSTDENGDPVIMMLHFASVEEDNDPGDNATWTAENMLNYGSSITWFAK